jgi:methionyl-tRNA formyltransferase
VVSALRLAFFGTPAFAVPTLQQLQDSPHQVALVVTQPDRPRGRGQRLAPAPVKTFAEMRGLPILQPERLKDDELLQTFAGFRLDLAVVAAYGRILPAAMLALPRLGTINVHASLLPRWRGAAPIHRAVLAGDHETGVTIMRVVPALDAGPMMAKARVPIEPRQTSVELEEQLAHIGARLLLETVDRLAAGPVPEEPQDERGATYAARLERRESQVDWARDAWQIHNQVRGLQPWPVATVFVHGRRLRLLGSEVAEDRPGRDIPGTIQHVSAEAIDVAASPGTVRITRVQPEGGAPMTVRAFLNGHPLNPGDRFDPVPSGP